MMPNSPPSPTYSTYSAPPLGHFTYTRPTLQAPQHAKARQTILSRPNGIPRMSVAMNQGNFVDTPDMNGPQISGSQLSIRPRVNHALGNGSIAESSLEERLSQQEQRITQQDKRINQQDQRILQQDTRIFQLEASFNEHTKILNQMRCYLDSQIDNSLDPPLYLEAPDGSNQRTLLQ